MISARAAIEPLKRIAVASRSPSPRPSGPARPVGRKPRPKIIHSSLYLPEAVYERLREVAFKERRKINEIVLEGIGMALRKRGQRH
jgi:hypothetical protein